MKPTRSRPSTHFLLLSRHKMPANRHRRASGAIEWYGCDKRRFAGFNDAAAYMYPSFCPCSFTLWAYRKEPPWHPNAAGWFGCVITSLGEVRGPSSSYLIPDNECGLAGKPSTCGYNSRSYRLSTGYWRHLAPFNLPQFTSLSASESLCWWHSNLFRILQPKNRS